MEIVIFCIVMFVGVVYGYYTVDGSGIAEHPYHDIYGGAPGAFAPVFGQRGWRVGSFGRHRL